MSDANNIAKHELAHFRSIKKFHVFLATDHDDLIPYVYVPKSAFDTPEPPARIVITVAVAAASIEAAA